MKTSIQINPATKSSPYAVLDKLVLDALGDGAKSFTLIYVAEVRKECDRLMKELGKDSSMRVLDTRLQALRKGGKIVYDRKANWELVK